MSIFSGQIERYLNRTDGVLATHKAAKNLTFRPIYVLVLFMVRPMPSPLSSPDPHEAALALGAGGCVGGGKRTERHLRMLAELAEIGMDLARHVRLQVLGLAETAEGGDCWDGAEAALPEVSPSRVNTRGGMGADLGLVFSRVARAVRQTVALEARLASDALAQKPGRELREAAAEARLAASERARVRKQKDRVRGLVEAAISAEAGGRDGESLRLDLDERLEDPDVEAELGWRPIGVIVAGICDDLGIKADLSRFTDAELGFDFAAMKVSTGDGGGVAAEIGWVASSSVDPGGDPTGGAASAAPAVSPGTLPGILPEILPEASRGPSAEPDRVSGGRDPPSAGYRPARPKRFYMQSR